MSQKGGFLMKTLRWIVLTAVLICLPTISYPSTLGNLHISFIEGDVQIYTEDTGDWVPASINMPLKDGDRIWVPGGGRFELRLRDGTVLRLDEKTALDILTLEKDSYQFYLPDGKAYVNFKGSRGSMLQVDTPMSSFRAYERAIFRIDILDDRHTDLSVYKGSVYAESQDGRTRVDQDRTLALRDGFTAELGPMGPPDEWERWNRSRNRIYAERRAPSPHLPEELYPYSNDFEDNGRWVYVREYGHVWTPTVVVSAGWAPYRLGRWVWIRGDYVWVSYEPWGWAPYHYGRWIFTPSFGWCWVPPERGAVYWGPGFVGWVRTPTYVSWVPLAPREIYYGYGYYGPHSVNILNINITTINVKKVVYKNVHVHNAVTVVHQDTFIHGRHVEVKSRENLFLRERIHIGRPDIKPERPTVMPVIREIHQGKRPPEKIHEIKIREIRERRPLTRERETSVMKPQTPSREMELKRKEIGPIDRKVDRIGDRSGEREFEKGRERKFPAKEAEKPIGRKPIERIERPVETKPVEKGVERSRDPRAPAERIEKQPESKPQEKGEERIRERAPQPGIERPKEDRKPVESERGRSRERSTLERKSEMMREREDRRPVKENRQEKEPQIQRERRPEREVEKHQEVNPAGRGTERHEETSIRESEGRRSMEPGSGREGSSRGRDRKP
jgi:hypothetical protein